MEALMLVDDENIFRTKIPRGQHKLLLKAIRPLQPSQASMMIGNANESNVATCADRPPTCERPAGSGQQSTEPAPRGVIDDFYTRLMSDLETS